jgi:hypothetical protein
MGESFMLTGDDIDRARWLAVRSALKLETKGLKRGGRSARQLANEITGKNDRTAKAAYASLDEFITGKLGQEFSRPL